MRERVHRLNDLMGAHASKSLIAGALATITLFPETPEHAESTSPTGLTQLWHPDYLSFSLVEAPLCSVLKNPSFHINAHLMGRGR